MLDSLGASANGGSLDIFPAASGAPLVSFQLPSPAFSPADNGRIVSNAIGESAVKNSGVASRFSVFSAAGAEIYNGSVGVSSGELRMNSTDLTARDLVEIKSLVVSAS